MFDGYEKVFSKKRPREELQEGLFREKSPNCSRFPFLSEMHSRNAQEMIQMQSHPPSHISQGLINISFQENDSVPQAQGLLEMEIEP